MTQKLFIAVLLFGVALSARVPTKFLQTGQEFGEYSGTSAGEPQGPPAGGPPAGGHGEGEHHGPPEGAEPGNVKIGAISGIFHVDDRGIFGAKLAGHIVPKEAIAGLLDKFHEDSEGADLDFEFDGPGFDGEFDFDGFDGEGEFDF